MLTPQQQQEAIETRIGFEIIGAAARGLESDAARQRAIATKIGRLIVENGILQGEIAAMADLLPQPAAEEEIIDEGPAENPLAG